MGELITKNDIYDESARTILHDDLMLSGGCITKVCKDHGIKYGTFCAWRREDPEFDRFVRDCIEEARESLIDDAQNIVKRKLVDDDIDSAWKILKTLGRKRGFSEKQEIEVSGDVNVKWSE